MTIFPIKIWLFDVSLLTPTHLLYLAGSLAVTYCALTVWWRLRPSFWKNNWAAGSLLYAGPVLIITAAILYTSILPSELWLGFSLAAAIIFVIGTLDERLRLSPALQLLGQAGVAIVVVSSGLRIPYITNPAAPGIIQLDWGVAGVSVGSILAVLWIVALINAINFFDGVDGLAGSISLVAFIMLAGISLLPVTQDNTTLQLSLVGLGLTLAFLAWNWHPARMYLGTSGTWLLGLMLAVTSVIGGGKIATTMLVLLIPIVDILIVALQRIQAGRYPWQGDRQRHVHFKLQKIGLSPVQICVVVASISAALGVAALILPTMHKLWLIGLAVLTLGLLSFTVKGSSPHERFSYDKK